MTDISLMCWGDLCDGRPLDKCAFKVKVVYKLPRAERSLALQPFFPFVKDRHVLVRTDNVAVVLYINHQADSPYCLLQRLVERFLLRADWNPISIREVHVPSRLNCSVDILSRGDSSRRMEATPSDRPDDLEPVWSSGGRFVCLGGERALPAVLFTDGHYRTVWITEHTIHSKV